MGRVNVRVQPGARKGRVIGSLADGTFKLAVTARPVDGRANEAVTSLVATVLGVRRRDVRIVRGATSRAKTIEVDGMEHDEIARRFEAARDA